MTEHKGWIGVDLDGTLAHYDGWRGVEHVGAPIGPMLERVKAWLAEGREVRIFTARVAPCESEGWDEGAMREATRACEAIREWCVKHIGQTLKVTSVKDYGMIELWDDRCVRVVVNTGRRCCANGS